MSLTLSPPEVLELLTAEIAACRLGERVPVSMLSSRKPDWLWGLMDAHWRRFVAPLPLPLRGRRLSGPATSGVYLLWDGPDQCTYVGRSNNMQRRLAEHHEQRVKQYTAFATIECPEELSDLVECAYIEAVDPWHNAMRRASGWDGHAAMVEAICDAWGMEINE